MVEEKKCIKISLFSVILILIILVLVVGIIYIFLENQKLYNQIIGHDDTAISTNNISSEAMNATDNLVNQLSEKNKTIEQLENEIAELKKNNSENQSSDSTNSYEISTIKNIYDVISDNDTKIEKAQKIAKEVMSAVNNKDWYYLETMVGTDVDYFVKYGIYNYNVNVNDYEEYDGEYVFSESYDWDKSKLNSPEDISLGNMLIIKFEDSGRIVIDPNCTGI